MEQIADGPLFWKRRAAHRDDQGGRGRHRRDGDVNEMDDICAIAGIRAAGLRADDHFEKRRSDV